ncbi:MAG: alkaline phosphatase D family protein [Alphaproteobacteria bacterium]|nr:alkaline phosphatase D family protein [Alphaproteobacteria bacterium]
MSVFGNAALNRRQILAGIGAGASAALVTGRAGFAQNQSGFTHGIASGDPLADRVILWTRYMPSGTSNASVNYQVATDSGFLHIVSQGQTRTSLKKDYTVKVDARGLAPDTRYYYRFEADGQYSPVGQTKTLPNTGADKASMAVISCSNYPQGFFHVYRELADRDVDMVLHLGDYIYEYADGIYSNDEITAGGRTVQPKHEIVVLDDYRRRYALYRSDPDLQAAHARHPFICVWDDHEIANNTWKAGAQNHNEVEGDFEDRKKAAVQAYHEWLPIRDNPAGKDKINRTFNIGGLASLIMLDTRLCGRDEQLDYEKDLPLRTLPFDFSDKDDPKAILSADAMKAAPKGAIKHIPVPFDMRGEKPAPMTDYTEISKLDPKALPQGFSYLPDGDKFKKDVLGAESRTIMGMEQEKWLDNELQASAAHNIPWQILGQQLLIGRVGIPMLKDEDIDWEKSKYVSKERFQAVRMLGSMGMPLNLDFWDGYPACRDRVYMSIKAKANNAVFLSGDTHNAWCFELTDSEGDNVAVEFATPSVSSPGMEAYIPAPPERVVAEVMKASNELSYFNSHNRGWMELNITEDEIASSWFFVSTVHAPDYTVSEGPTIRTKAGSHKVTKSV